MTVARKPSNDQATAVMHTLSAKQSGMLAKVVQRVDRLAAGLQRRASAWAPCRTKARPQPMSMVAHRGASHTAPENTVASMELAFRQGAKGVEFDVQLSRDGEVFLLHDDTLRRTAAPQCPAGISAEEYESVLDTDVSRLDYWETIRHVDVGSWKSAAFGGEKCCLMEEAMATLPPGGFALCEVKGGDTATAKAVADLTKSKGWGADKLTFIGADPQVMAELKALLREQGLGDIKVILVVEAFSEVAALAGIVTAKGLGLDGIDFEADTTVVTAKVVRAARAEALEIGVWVWSILPKSDTPPTADRMELLGIDFFTSDLPPAMCEWMAGATRRV